MDTRSSRQRAPRLDWAGLLRRTFALDVFACPRCSGKRRVLAHVLALPLYSPDLNPIELAWSKLKSVLRSFEARTRVALDEAIAIAMDLMR